MINDVTQSNLHRPGRKTFRVDVTLEQVPRRFTRIVLNHDAIYSVERRTPQNKWHHAARKIATLSEATGGDSPITPR